MSAWIWFTIGMLIGVVATVAVLYWTYRQIENAAFRRWWG